MSPLVAARRLLSLPSRVIDDDCSPQSGPLLIRYYVLSTPLVAVFVHHLMRSDNDRDWHDHPWSFVTVLLSSGYREHTPRGTFWRRRFSILYRPATWLHWLELERPTWTLVIRFRRVREWGFVTPRGWVHWRDYGRRDCEDGTRGEKRPGQAEVHPGSISRSTRMAAYFRLSRGR